MKTKDLWFVMAAAAMLTGTMTLVSCSKDDDLLPEVIESEVYDEGATEEVTAEVGAEGTTLSYESWIMVKGITRATFDNKVSVTLNGRFGDVSAVCPVNYWDIGSYETAISRETADLRTSGFVTVTDSVLVYTVKYDEFSFSFRLNYEVAVYDDGVTRQTMPYYYYGNISDNGGVLEDADSYIDGDRAYARKIYRHSITVEFGGETYDVWAAVTLRRELGLASEPYILSSNVLAKSVELDPGGEGFVSSITVRSKMSTGTEEEKTYTVTVPVFGDQYTGDLVTVSGTFADLELLGWEMEETERWFYSEGECITLERVGESCVLHYNYFDLAIRLWRHEAVFDNIVLQENMFSDVYDVSSFCIRETDWVHIESNEAGEHYFLTLTAEIKMGELNVESIYNGWFLFVR